MGAPCIRAYFSDGQAGRLEHRHVALGPGATAERRISVDDLLSDLARRARKTPERAQPRQRGRDRGASFTLFPQVVARAFLQRRRKDVTSRRADRTHATGAGAVQDGRPRAHEDDQPPDAYAIAALRARAHWRRRARDWLPRLPG